MSKSVNRFQSIHDHFKSLTNENLTDRLAPKLRNINTTSILRKLRSAQGPIFVFEYSSRDFIKGRLLDAFPIQIQAALDKYTENRILPEARSIVKAKLRKLRSLGLITLGTANGRWAAEITSHGRAALETYGVDSELMTDPGRYRSSELQHLGHLAHGTYKILEREYVTFSGYDHTHDPGFAKNIGKFAEDLETWVYTDVGLKTLRRSVIYHSELLRKHLSIEHDKMKETQ